MEFLHVTCERMEKPFAKAATEKNFQVDIPEMNIRSLYLLRKIKEF